ncbi:MAG: glucoamylase family protein [Bacteroidales bacterium]
MKRLRVGVYSLLMLAIIALTNCTNSKGKPESGANPESVRPETFVSDEEMLDYIQRVHLNYMWDGAEATSGMACERIHPDGIYPSNDQDIVTLGGSGFGVAGLIVAVERGFIDRSAVVERMHKIVDYLAKADRFHGMWPHWLVGPTGVTKGFGTKDDGGDIVESAFMMQGLICAREYFNGDSSQEKALVEKINKLWHEMDFNFYQQDNHDVLYWHWSPTHGWEMNFPIEGYNECLIAYILGASSPTHPIPASAYHKGWARDGAIVGDEAPYGYPLRLAHNAQAGGGSLFWAHYSYIGFSPKGSADKYANFWDVTRNHVMANYAHCVDNPKNYKGYSEKCWGLTAGYTMTGYSAHDPHNDLGVITPTAALSSFPYAPEEAMRALKYFYFEKGDKLWGKYGFYDGFSESNDWYSNGYLAIDQLTIAPMIENYRTGLLWKLFMNAPEIKSGLEKLGITYAPEYISNIN